MYIIYGKEDCSQCTKAISLLTSKNERYHVLKLGTDFDLQELLLKVEQMHKPKPRSFPVIFSRDAGWDYWVGSYDDLLNLLNRG